MRHETDLEPKLLKQYEKACKELNRSMRQQTAFLISEFLKKRGQKKIKERELTDAVQSEK